jgi:hypothetical protein
LEPIEAGDENAWCVNTKRSNMRSKVTFFLPVGYGRSALFSPKSQAYFGVCERKSSKTKRNKIMSVFFHNKQNIGVIVGDH